MSLPLCASATEKAQTPPLYRMYWCRIGCGRRDSEEVQLERNLNLSRPCPLHWLGSLSEEYLVQCTLFCAFGALLATTTCPHRQQRVWCRHFSTAMHRTRSGIRLRKGSKASYSISKYNCARDTSKNSQLTWGSLKLAAFVIVPPHAA
jgi:hypothetical protein